MASLGANERVIDTHNLFIDTSKAAEESSSKGDDFILNLSSLSLNADEGQFLRLTLTEFSMYKNFTDVNENNNKIVFYYTGGSNPAASIELTKQNYSTVYDLAADFATQFGKAVLTEGGTSFTITTITPTSATGINGTTDNIISFTLTFASNHGLTPTSLMFYEGKGDSYALLGADRQVDGSVSTPSGVNITSTANTMTVNCRYPAQRSTTSHIYLRTSLTTGATETVSLAEEAEVADKSEVLSSNLLGRIPVNTEFCVYVSSTGREYFIDLRQKHINNIRLYLTDQHNRRIGRRPIDTTKQTASGGGVSQSTLGNLDFSCVVRADIIEFRRPQDLGLPSVRQNIPSNHPLTYPNLPPF